MIKLFFITTAFLICEYVSAQKFPVDQQKSITVDNEQNRKAIGQSIISIQKATAGSYQLILSDPNHQFAVNDAFLIWIEENRKQTEDQYIAINEYIKVFVPAVKTIQSEDFKPLQSVTVN